MTKRKIDISINKIKKFKVNGHHLEAVICYYHLNLDLIKFLLEASVPHTSLKNKKVKEVLSLLAIEVDANPTLKTLISKRNLRPVKLWLKQMDVFFKLLKKEIPKNVPTLLLNAEANFKLLNISANKLFQ